MELTFLQQSTAFLYSLVLGVVLGALYTPFKLFRIAFCTKKISVYTADIIYMLCVSIIIFYFSLAYLYGYIRVYVILGSMAGFFAYRFTIGRAFSKFHCPFIAFFKKSSRKIHLKIKKIAEKLLKIAYKILYNIGTKITLYKNKRYVASKNKRVMARNENIEKEFKEQTGGSKRRRRHN